MVTSAEIMTPRYSLRMTNLRRTLSLLGTVVLGQLCLPGDVVAWCALLLVRALWGSSSRWSWSDEVLVVSLREGSWPARTWFRSWGGATLGHAVMLAPGQERVLPHELVHVKQYEAACCLGALVGLVVLALGSWRGALAAWCLAPALSYVGAMLAALLRGRAPYRENVLEAAAYAEAP